VSLANVRGISRGKKPFLAELPEGLEEPISRRTLGVLRQRHGSGDQRLNCLLHFQDTEILTARDGLGRIEREPTGEYAQPIEDALLLWLEQIVRPGDRLVQRLMAFNAAAPSCGVSPRCSH